MSLMGCPSRRCQRRRPGRRRGGRLCQCRTAPADYSRASITPELPISRPAACSPRPMTSWPACSNKFSLPTTTRVPNSARSSAASRRRGARCRLTRKWPMTRMRWRCLTSSWTASSPKFNNCSTAPKWRVRSRLSCLPPSVINTVAQPEIPRRRVKAPITAAAGVMVATVTRVGTPTAVEPAVAVVTAPAVAGAAETLRAAG